MDRSQTPELFNGRYKRLYKLGQGGMGQVWKCYDTILKKEVALKVLLRSASDRSKQRFQKEAKALAKLKHKSIVEVLDFGITDSGDIYMVMEYAGGVDLKQHIESHGPLPVDDVVVIISQILDGLRNAHKKGFIHRDIKPSNILLVDSGDSTKIKIVDFGTVKILEENQSISNPKAIIGSPYYIAPEAIEKKQTDMRSDIYSLGCLIFKCLTGEVPFKAATAQETLIKHVSETAPKMKNVESEFFQNLVDKCIAKDPDKRYQTTDELLSELIDYSDQIVQEDFELIEDEPFQVRVSYGKWAVIAICLGVFAIAVVLHMTPKEFKASDPIQKPIVSHDSHSTSMAKYFDTNKFRKEGDCIHGFIDSTDEDLLNYLKEHKDTGCWDLGKSDISDRSIRNLNLEKLYYLSVFKTKITDHSMKLLSQAPNLYLLDIGECYGVTAKGFEQLTDLPKLQVVSLEGRQLSSDWIKVLIKMKSLKYLNYLGNISSQDVRLLAEHLDLTAIKIENPDENAARALAGFKNLRDLSIEGTVSGASIHSILNSGVKRFYLSQAKIEKLDMHRHLSKVGQLKTITFPRLIDPMVVRYFRKKHPRVKVLVSELFKSG